MSEKEILHDIVAYCPAVAGVTSAMPAKETQRLIGNYNAISYYITLFILLFIYIVKFHN